MAGKPPRLEVVFADDAIEQLNSIWQWNATHYSATHADQYLSYLRQGIEALCKNYAKGRQVPSRSDLMYLQIRKRSSGPGHVVVYYFDEKLVYVLNVFHTAQDWSTKLSD